MSFCGKDSFLRPEQGHVEVGELDVQKCSSSQLNMLGKSGRMSKFSCTVCFDWSLV